MDKILNILINILKVFQGKPKALKSLYSQCVQIQ